MSDGRERRAKPSWPGIVVVLCIVAALLAVGVVLDRTLGPAVIRSAPRRESTQAQQDREDEKLEHSAIQGQLQILINAQGLDSSSTTSTR